MSVQAFFAQAMRVVLILWGALTFSNVLLGVVTVVVRAPTPQRSLNDMTTTLGVVALAVIVASFVVPARMYAVQAGRRRPQMSEGGGMGAPARFAHPEQAARYAMASFQTAFIVSMALSENVSLLGLVLRQLGAPLTTALPFIVVGTLLAAARFPRLKDILARYERIHGATFAASTGPSY